jgi:agmatine deiminase
MPAEWEPHYSTILAFPHHRTDFPRKLISVAHTFAEMARVLSAGERVRLLVADKREQERAHRIFEAAGVNMERVDFLKQRTNRSWMRDSMPLWVTRGRKASGAREKKGAAPQRSDAIAVKFRFNGWARYRDHKWDDEAGRRVARDCAPRYCHPESAPGELAVLEGGSIDVDGAGTLLTTSECLVTSARARFSSQEQAETVLKETLGVTKILWLPQGIVGDDTSGHVDDFARFGQKGQILLCEETKKSDANYAPLRAARLSLRRATDARGRALKVVGLPMPDPVYYDGDRLPASYANFYVGNAAVLVPTFNDAKDRDALSIIQECYPDRPVVGIHARDLVVGLGTLHCSTMQEPL